MVLLKILLYPISLLYGLITLIRNKFYDWHIFPSYSMDVPVISIGNLGVGGTGKTPHVIYLCDLLKEEFTVGIVSRGYRRKTKGFHLAGENADATTIGDEPMQFYYRFADDPVYIAVDEKRVRGCRELLKAHSEIDVILLDDAFQHRAITPGMNILLCDFFHPYYRDFLMPTDRLREFRGEAKRADIILVSKTGKVLSPITRRTLEEQIKPRDYQEFYFSYINYGKPTPMPKLSKTPKWGKTYAILMITGIANAYPLEARISDECSELHKLKYPDHHRFTTKDAEKIKKTFEEIVSVNKIIITTEKDAMRLSIPNIRKILGHLPIYYWPIHVDLHDEDKDSFNKKISDYVRQNTRNR